jgi:hypothetical protein
MTADHYPEGWISVDISEANERWAKAKRAERDRQYGNIYREAATDERWVGDLGELVFDKWLKHHQVEGYDWILEGAAGAPDFRLASGIRIGVKTVKRKGPPLEGYTAQITARHTKEPIEHFFFMSYEIAKRRMWLLGGIHKQGFLEGAVYVPAGSQVHANYTIREGHEIYNIDIGKLLPPREWLGSLAGL